MKNPYRYIQQSLSAPALFILKLLILHFLLKLLFFSVNFPVSGTGEWMTVSITGKLIYWAITNDLLVICLIQLAWFMVWTITGFFRSGWLTAIVSWIFILVHFVALLLNVVDVFYVHFQRQRANADLLYVTQHPFHKTLVHHPWWTLLCLILATALLFIIYRFYRGLKQQYDKGWRPWLPALFLAFLLSCVLFISPGRQMPTYPLVGLSSNQLMYVQNSFHSFLYSVYRNHDGMVKRFRYMPETEAKMMAAAEKRNNLVYDSHPKKNIVLFIMESIPQDFFDEQGSYKVAMPFLDSLKSHSLYFDRAYSYSHNSNKGIVAILGGMPTLTEIPLYHSTYTGLPMTAIGSRLADSGYRSMFFIGDDYDDFGFAKCTHWMGFDRYYSKEDIPGFRGMASHTMGLHDEYVLRFMLGELNRQQGPFFAVHYNTSTHYPNDLPATYREVYPKENRSDQMKSMSYYNRCLEEFFSNAALQPWFRHTVFLFCSDHWMFPDTKSPVSDVVQSFRIPIMLYDPEKQAGAVIREPVSQLDMLNTVLAIAGDRATYISYGENLLDTARLQNRVIISRENANLYQAFDRHFVLGFNPVNGKAEFLYDIRQDPGRVNNLVSVAMSDRNRLEKNIQAFLQRVSAQYTDPNWKR